MELTEDETYKNMLKIVGVVIEILYYHMNVNGLAFHVVTM